MILFINLSTLPVWGQGVLSSVKSKPNNLVIYHPNNWSNIGVWDFSDREIFEGMVIKEINLKWNDSSSQNQSYRGLHIALFNEEGKGVLLSEQFIRGKVNTDFFKDQDPAQRWEVKYYVEDLQRAGNYFSISPRISINYQRAKDEDEEEEEEL